MFTSTQLLVFLSVAVILLAGYGYSRRVGSSSGSRLVSVALPVVFLLLAGFLGSNVFNMISNGRISVRRYYLPHTFSSDTLFFWFLVALQIGVAFLFLAAALKSWQRRDEA